jgi:hypothetical protein
MQKRPGPVKKFPIFWIYLLVLNLIAVTAIASGRGIRCGGDLVGPGYLKYEVWQRCGEPLSKDIVGEVEFGDSGIIYDRNDRRFKDRDRRVYLYIEEWLYKTDGLYVLRFEGNTLVNVESVRPK